MTQRKYTWQLLIFPLGILLLRFSFYRDTSNYYMAWTDPIYAYLFNGLNLAQGYWEIGHYDHPGTTVQVFAALIIRCVYLFRSDVPLAEDVLTNPELYIGVATFALIFIHSLLVFITGRVIYTKTQNIFLALFFQIMSLASRHAVGFSNNLMPETFLVLSGNLFVLVFFLYILVPQPSGSKEISHGDIPYSNTKYLWIFSLLTGFSIATKFSSFTVLLIPFILLEGVKRKIWYLVLSCIFSVIFMLPAISKMEAIWDWIVKLLMHSGRYGRGESTITNFKEFTDNLYAIFYGETPFIISYVLIFFVIIFCLVKASYKNFFWNREFKLLLGIFLLMTIQILLVAKHFSEHYLIPAHVFIPLAIYLSCLFLKKMFENSLIQYWSGLSKYVVLCIVSAIFLYRIVMGFGYFPGGINPKLQTAGFLSAFSQTPHVIVHRYITAYPEPSLYFGAFYAGGKMQPFYKEKLNKIYPNTYFYTINENNIYNWYESVSLPEIISLHKNILIYYADSNLIRGSLLYHEIQNLTEHYDGIYLEKIFYNKISTESIYRLSTDTSFKMITNKQEIVCNMDSLSADKKIFVSSDSNYFFQKGEQQSQERYFSGKNSVKLTKEQPYAMDFNFKVKEGEVYEMSAWRYSPDKNGVMVVSAKNSSIYYITSTYANDAIFYEAGAGLHKGMDGWEQVRLKFSVNKNINDSVLGFYLWNNGTENIFFDDLKIKKISYSEKPEAISR